MSSIADEILAAGIKDSHAAVAALQRFEDYWRAFADACHAQQIDVAHEHGQRLIALVEVVVDLHLSSVKRMEQFERLTKERDV